MSAKLPLIQQMQDAGDNRARADLLLRCSDGVVLKYADALVCLCRHAGFEVGEVFVQCRVAAMLATRTGAGGLPGRLAMDVETLRAALAAYSAGAPEWRLDAPQPAGEPPSFGR